MDKQPCVYILASKHRGTLYTGVTSNLVKRVYEHKHNFVEGFTKKYNIHLLVWYELHATMYAAIEKDKMIKNWKRDWKIELIEQENSRWRDLYSDLF